MSDDIEKINARLYLLMDFAKVLAVHVHAGGTRSARSQIAGQFAEFEAAMSELDPPPPPPPSEHDRASPVRLTRKMDNDND